LNYLRKNEILSPDHPALLPLLYREIAVLETEIKRTKWFQPAPDSLINTLLNQRIAWSYERVFRILGLILPPESIYDAYLAWSSQDARKRDAALEVLEDLLSPDLRERLLPLLENSPDQEVEENPAEMRRKAVQMFLEEKDPLIISASVLEISDQELQTWYSQFRDLLAQEPNILIQETIDRRSAGMSQEQNRPLTMLEKMESLSKISIFSQLSPAELLVLSEIAVEADFKKGEMIYKEGEPAEEIFSLLSGKVDLMRDEHLIYTVEPGDSFGTLGVLSNHHRISSAVAAEDSRCLKIQGETFWEILEDYTPVCHGVIEVLVQQVEQLTAKLAGVETEVPRVKL
jgi:hypothetical protein